MLQAACLWHGENIAQAIADVLLWKLFHTVKGQSQISIKRCKNDVTTDVYYIHLHNNTHYIYITTSQMQQYNCKIPYHVIYSRHLTIKKEELPIFQRLSFLLLIELTLSYTTNTTKDRLVFPYYINDVLISQTCSFVFLFCFVCFVFFLFLGLWLSNSFSMTEVNLPNGFKYLHTAVLRWGS